MPIRHLWLICCLSWWLALPAVAEQCIANGTHTWTSVEAGDWPCDASGDDHFVLDSADDFVELTDEILLSSGSISCSAGQLVIWAGATLRWTGPDDGTQELLIEDDCVFRMEGVVTWQGRLQSVGWGAGTTPEETRLGLPSSPDFALPGHYVHFAWDDFEPIGEPITRQIQTEPGQPVGNLLHPSYNVGQFWRISAVGANHVDAFHSTEQDLDLLDGVRDGTPSFDPPGISGPPTSSYVGTRELVTGVIPTSMQIGKHLMFTRLSVPNSTGVTDGDFGGRYVTWEAGLCVGQRWKVVGFEDENAGNDVVIVAGDATECGLSSFALTPGAGPGDLVRIVSRPTIDGNDIAHVRIRGGQTLWRYARFVRLDRPQTLPETPSLFAQCALCIYQESATSQIKPGSVMENLEVGYTLDDTLGAFVVALNSIRDHVESNTLYARRFDNLLDFCVVSARGWWIHDEHNKATVADGSHGLISTAGCLALHGVRVERLSDDALYIFTSHLGSNTPPSIDIRMPLLYENMGEGDTTQECLVLQTDAFGEGDQNSIVDTSVDLRDIVAIGCDDTVWIGTGLGNRFDRLVLGSASLESFGSSGIHIDLGSVGNTGSPSSGCGGPGVPSPCCSGVAQGTCTWPLRGVERFPNLVSNMILFPFVPDGINAIQQRFGGRIRDSVVAVSNAANHVLVNLYGAQRSFLSLRGNNPNIQRHFGTIYPAPGGEDTTNANSVYYGPDLVVINEFEPGWADRLCATDYDPISLQTLEIQRFWYLGADSPSSGWLEPCADTAGLEVNANGWILSGWLDGVGNGRGLGHGALTDQGATILNACVETLPSVSPDGPEGFGAQLNASAVHLDVLEPDADDDLPLRSYSALHTTPVCNGAPRHFGLRDVGAAHVLGLGDGGLRQLDHFSTLDLPGAQIPALDPGWLLPLGAILAGVGVRLRGSLRPRE